MKKFFIQSIILIVVIFGALFFTTSKNFSGLPINSVSTTQTRILVKDVTVNVEIADTPDKRRKGLSGRDSLASDSGMLFTFDKPIKQGFWMKDMKFGLDLIWIRDKKIVDIIKDAKPPEANQDDRSLPVYMPNQEIDGVLEVNSGFVDSHNINIGDNIEIVQQ